MDIGIGIATFQTAFSQPAGLLVVTKPTGRLLCGPLKLDLERSQSNIGLYQGLSRVRCLAWNCASSRVVDEPDRIGFGHEGYCSESNAQFEA